MPPAPRRGLARVSLWVSLAMNKPLLLALCLGLLGACAAPSDALPELSIGGGKADVSDQVNLRGSIAFGGEVTGELTDDLQYDAYAFRARAGAVVRLETTQRGSARDLDDLLMVYGPGDEVRGYADAVRVGSDTDSGWGAHARIEELTLEDEGSYLVIIGAQDTVSRGQYRITLGCESGECAPEAPTATVCPGLILGRAELCMDAAVNDDGESLEGAFEHCASEDTLLDQYIDACEFSSSPPAYCDVGEATLQSESVPSCQQAIGFDHGLVAGPGNPDRVADFAAYIEEVEATDVPVESRFGDGFDGENGLRPLRESALTSAQANNAYATAGAWDLVDLNSSWEEILTYEDEWEGFTETREVEWYVTEVYEVWNAGEVVGLVVLNAADVSWWHPSDPDDATTDTFYAALFLTLDGEVEADLYGGP